MMQMKSCGCRDGTKRKRSAVVVDDKGIPSVVEVCPKTWSMVLAAGVRAPVDLEGLLFGYKPGLVEGFKLVGAAESAAERTAAGEAKLTAVAESLVRAEERQGRMLVGWCSLRGPELGAAAPKLDFALEPREETLHRAIVSSPMAMFCCCCCCC
ncbi:unnamed protein product [Polarella glacialis]|uniref:Uncharacterized protein n=1 Tax=Polarella glacialis TaxID=89957 RepID=A0A813D5G2_POLGL|nr:unnamed protein product [Polarella glacialis]